MNIVFCGTARGIGTSANMTVVQEALRCRGFMEERLHFIDCSRQKSDLQSVIHEAALLVVNVFVPNTDFYHFYFNHSLVHKNVIFLFGKYFQQHEKNLQRFSKEYHIDACKIAQIPYNLRFAQAFENGKVETYLRQRPRRLEDEEFAVLLWKTTQKILNGIEKEKKHGRDF